MIRSDTRRMEPAASVPSVFAVPIEDVLAAVQGTRVQCIDPSFFSCWGRQERARSYRVWVTDDFLELRSCPSWPNLFCLFDLVAVRADTCALSLEFQVSSMRLERSNSGSLNSFVDETVPASRGHTNSAPIAKVRRLVLVFEQQRIMHQWLNALTACAPSSCQFMLHALPVQGSRRSSNERRWQGAHILGFHDELGPIDGLHWRGKPLTTYPKHGADGRYVFLCVLGRGSMGEVLLAMDLYSRRFYAVKQAILRCRFDTQTGSLRDTSACCDHNNERMLMEMELMRGLRHPNLVELIDILPAERRDASQAPSDAGTEAIVNGDTGRDSAQPLPPLFHGAGDRRTWQKTDASLVSSTDPKSCSASPTEQMNGQSMDSDLPTASDSLVLARERDRLRWIRDSGLKPLVSDGSSRELSVPLQLVVEFVPGFPVLQSNQLVMNQSLSEDVALFVLWQVANGLATLHARNIVHRDIKPDNLLLHVDSTIKLNDFGTACVADAPDVQCLVGAPAFVAPEIISRVCQICDEEDDDVSTHTARSLVIDPIRNPGERGAPQCPTSGATPDSEISKRSDIWSLGATLYYLLFGRPPFLGDTLYELCENIMHQSVSFDRELHRKRSNSSGRSTDRARPAPWYRRRLSRTRSNALSEACTALLQGMLTKDPRIRLDIHGVLAHAALDRYRHMTVTEMEYFTERLRDQSTKSGAFRR